MLQLTQAKTTTLSIEQQSFVLKFLQAAVTIDKKRKITTRHVTGRINSLKKQGARGKTHFPCMSGGGATLDSFLTFLLCSESC
jgi:hypothetical protein